MGQQQLGRYPVHWHLVHQVYGDYARQLSIHDCFSRCVTLHGAIGVRVCLRRFSVFACTDFTLICCSDFVLFCPVSLHCTARYTVYNSLWNDEMNESLIDWLTEFFYNFFLFFFFSYICFSWVKQFVTICVISFVAKTHQNWSNHILLVNLKTLILLKIPPHLTLIEIKSALGIRT